VVVVAYRSSRDIGACLDSIELDRLRDSGIIVVDNASPDNSGAIAGNHPSSPVLIRSESNLGFGGACNLAARSTSAEYLFFVNPDARLTTGTTSRLRDLLTEDGSLAAAGPRVVDPAGLLKAASAGFEPSVRSAIGHFLVLGRLPILRSFFRPLQLPPRAPGQRVDWVGGAAMMVRTTDFNEVGGFDASIFLYMEDVDLCRRMRAQDRFIVYEPSVVVEHDVGGSQGADQAERWFWAFHEYVSAQHGGRYARVVSGIAAIGLGIRALVAAFGRRGNARRLAVAAVAASRATMNRKPRASLRART
jgi:N-acetylglucosaminyl-diphospho-decaprenol L-rhamnosyltransferase